MFESCLRTPLCNWEFLGGLSFEILWLSSSPSSLVFCALFGIPLLDDFNVSRFPSSFQFQFLSSGFPSHLNFVLVWSLRLCGHQDYSIILTVRLSILCDLLDYVVCSDILILSIFHSSRYYGHLNRATISNVLKSRSSSLINWFLIWHVWSYKCFTYPDFVAHSAVPFLLQKRRRLFKMSSCLH